MKTETQASPPSALPKTLKVGDRSWPMKKYRYWGDIEVDEQKSFAIEYRSTHGVPHFGYSTISYEDAAIKLIERLKRQNLGHLLNESKP